MPNKDSQYGADVLTEQKQKLQKPPLYKVLLHNDNYTTMEFVVFVLTDVFLVSENEAIRIMLQVHNQGLGVAGVYTYEIAETKVAKVAVLAQEHEYPLLCTLEEE
ncbi:MAG: ATP-dependent Clp protease adaptor ClpS [Acidobacteria bacterium]|nr:ATP-dependent Clp protease adaptor ClpS [Acidobacteriota bacterium]